MRVKILNRNSKCGKTIVDPDGMVVMHEPIPVVMGKRKVTVGKATNIRTERDGTYADIKLSDLVSDMAPAVSVRPLDFVIDKGIRIINRCVLLRIALVPPEQTDTDPISS